MTESALVSAEDIATFWRDGVVCIRGLLPVDQVLSLCEPVEAALSGAETADMSELGDVLAGAGSEVLREAGDRRGRFRSGVDHWRTRPEFAAFALESLVPQIVGEILEADVVRLYEDSVLSKEPGSLERTAWHQDLSYFNLSGAKLATTWIPLDWADQQTGVMRFVAASHRDPQVFQPNLFVSDEPIPGTAGPRVPDVDALGDQVKIVSFDLGPGDLTIHHAATLHAAGANRSPDRRRRALSIRYVGDDVAFLRREGTILKPYQRTLIDGDPLPAEECPVAWRREAR